VWVLSELADKLGFVLVAPTNGMGSWRETQSAAAVESALIAAGRVASIDRTQVHLAGLSNGGLAVSQLAGTQGARFKSLVFICPVFDRGQIGSADFVLQNPGRAMLAITGSRDDRVPLDYVEENVRLINTAGAKIGLQAIPDADHFLIFSHREQLVKILAAWFSGQADTPR